MEIILTKENEEVSSFEQDLSNILEKEIKKKQVRTTLTEVFTGVNLV